MSRATHMTKPDSRPQAAIAEVSLRGEREHTKSLAGVRSRQNKGNTMNTNVLEFPKLRRVVARASAKTGRAAIIPIDEHRAKSRVHRTLTGVFFMSPSNQTGGFLPAA